MDNPPGHFCPALECVIMLLMVLKTVLMVEPKSWNRRWRIDTTRVMCSGLPCSLGWSTTALLEVATPGLSLRKRYVPLFLGQPRWKTSLQVPLM